MDPCVRFLIGGVQKGGTTALFDHLREHPQLSLPSLKEAHFFDDEAVDWSAPDVAPYHALFDAESPGLRGEATPIYIYWPNSLQRIARYDSAMKLVFLFRDPVQRAWSHWKMEYARGFDTAPFAWAIREGRARVDDPAAPGAHRVYSYVERGFYGAQLRRVRALFPAEQVLLLRSEDLKRRPAETVARVCGFLGVDAPGEVAAKASNVAAERDYGSRLEAADATYLRDLYAEDLADFTAQSGLDTSGWMAGR